MVDLQAISVMIAPVLWISLLVEGNRFLIG
jgi:hypothetical protein